MSSSGAGARKIVPATIVVVANPAAGNDISFSLPSGGAFGPGPTYPAVFEIVAVRAKLITSAAVGSRIPFLYLTDPGGNAIAHSITDAAQPASTTYFYSWAKGMPYMGTAIPGIGTEKSLPMPSGVRLPAAGVALTYSSLLAGDQWSSVVVTYQAES